MCTLHGVIDLSQAYPDLVAAAREAEAEIRERSRPHPITHRYRPRYVNADLRAADVLHALANRLEELEATQ